MYKNTNIFLRIVLFFFYTSSITNTNCNTTSSRDIWIIVHGTFARTFSWHQPHGNFFSALQSATDSVSGHVPENQKFKDSKKNLLYSFQWSGKLSAQARLEGGIALKNFITSITQPSDNLHIICHSHGGNVAIIAATYLSHTKSDIYIDELILLGTPIPKNLKTPDMQRIKSIYNVFSYNDRVQPLLQDFKRVFAWHPNIFNIQIKLNKTSPSHKQLHDCLIAQHAPQLSKLMASQNHKDVILHIADTVPPSIEPDLTREKDLQKDKAIDREIILSLIDRHVSKSDSATDRKK